MSLHYDVTLQTYACGCLYSLCCFRPENPLKDNSSMAIARGGGIAGLLEAMRSYPSCREVQQWGVGALRHLAIEIGAGNRCEEADGGGWQLTMRGVNKRMIAK